MSQIPSFLVASVYRWNMTNCHITSHFKKPCACFKTLYFILTLNCSKLLCIWVDSLVSQPVKSLPWLYKNKPVIVKKKFSQVFERLFVRLLWFWLLPHENCIQGEKWARFKRLFQVHIIQAYSVVFWRWIDGQCWVGFNALWKVEVNSIPSSDRKWPFNNCAAGRDGRHGFIKVM